MKFRVSIVIFLSVLLAGTLNRPTTQELTVNNRTRASTGGLPHIQGERRSLAFISLTKAFQVGQILANKEDDAEEEEDEPLLPPRGESYTISPPQIRQFRLATTRDRFAWLG